MAEKLTRREKIALQKTAGVPSQKSKTTEKSSGSLKFSLGILCGLLGFLLYANTIGHDYVLDDFGLIKENSQVKQGFSAIPEIFKTSYRYGMNITDFKLYRPLSKAMFAAEWGISPNNPALSHFMNILFFAISCFVLFQFLAMCFKGNLLIPFITTLLFAAHPLHTEVVANIKSRDEIICFLLCISATMSFMLYAQKKSGKQLLLGTIWFFLALLTKESAITFFAIIPLVFYFFTNAERNKYVSVIVLMGISTLIFFAIRQKVLGNVESLIPVEDNSLAGIKDFLTQRANAIYILGVYMMKMVFPAPLISDGSFNSFPPVALTSWKFLVPFVILIASGIYAITRFRKKDPVSFAILFFFATVSIVSNVIILIGTNYGERLMYVPSLGFCIVVAILISKILKSDTVESGASTISLFLKRHSKPVIAITLIVVLFAFQTMARNGDWKNNTSLYFTDIKNVPNSAHMLFYIANHTTSEETLAEIKDSIEKVRVQEKAIEYLTRAVTIFPQYSDGYQRRGFIYNALEDQQKAEADYIEALKYNPTHSIVYNNYGTLCFKQRRYEEAKGFFEKAVRFNQNYAHALSNLASVYGVYGEGEREMISKDPAKGDIHATQSRENFDSAINYFQKAIKADPNFADPYRMLSFTYKNIGDASNAARYERLFNDVTAKNSGQPKTYTQ